MTLLGCAIVGLVVGLGLGVALSEADETRTWRRGYLCGYAEGQRQHAHVRPVDDADDPGAA